MASPISGRAARLAIAALVLLSLTAQTVHAGSGVFVGHEANVVSPDGLNVRTDPAPTAPVLVVAEDGDFVNVLEGPLLDNGDEWYKVEYDGTVGWVSGSFLGPPRDRASVSTRGQRGDVQASRVWLPVPYYSQFDGSAYQSANCGPTALSMSLAAFGKHVSIQELRRAGNRMQGTAGMFHMGLGIDVLADLASRHGLTVRGLRSGGVYDQWTFDEVRQALRNGNLVIPQVHLASMPGHGSSSRAVDHYVVITGFDGDSFYYNDPAFNGTAGYGMAISESALALAWRRGDYRFAAFSIGPGPGMEPLVAPPRPARRWEPPADLYIGPPKIDEALAAARLSDKAPDVFPTPEAVESVTFVARPLLPPADAVDRGMLATAPPAVQVIAGAVQTTYDATVTVGVEHVSSGVERISQTANGPGLWTSLGLAGLLAGMGARRQGRKLALFSRPRARRHRGAAELRLDDLRAETVPA